MKGLTRFQLKIIAIIAMFIDHAAVTFSPYLEPDIYTLMRAIGRLTFPIMAFMIVEGYYKTSNVKRYITRLLIFGIVTIVPYFMLFYTDNGIVDFSNIPNLILHDAPFNVMFTLMFGLCSLYFCEKFNSKISRFFIVVLFTVLSIPCDWGVIGVLGIYFMGKMAPESRSGKGVLIIFLISAIKPIFDNIIQVMSRTGDLSLTLRSTFYNNWLINTITLRVAMLFSIPLLKLYNGEKGIAKNNEVLDNEKIYFLKEVFSKYLFYIFYPLHLIILYVLRAII